MVGGISSAGITLRDVTQAAASPVTHGINRQSTRRDLQSGQMVTDGRLNHLAAGNSILNPAYRQHVMERLQKTQWGRQGGTASKGD